MNVQIHPQVAVAERRPPFECIALVLQGGGVLGAYQAGVYEALAEAGIHPDWIASMSIGAINAAIIAGNPPNSRVDRLREFWMQVTADRPWSVRSRLGTGRCVAAVAQPRERGLRNGERGKRFFLGTTGASMVSAGRNDRGHQLL